MAKARIYTLVFVSRVFGAIVYSATGVGQMSHFAPDAGKPKAAANRLFHLLDRQPAIDSTSTEGQKPVSFAPTLTIITICCVAFTRM